MRRPLLTVALALALVAPASARALSTFRLETDRAIRIEVINGFPQPPGAEGDVATFALDVWSQGARELVVDVDGPCRLHQKLAVPANERRRFFFYAPRLSGTDWSQAAMLRIAGLPGPESARTFGIPQLAQFSSDLQVGQLGRISSPVSVETGWALAGDVTEAFPDHWRGLSGFTALIVEQSTLASRPAWLPVVRDWVLMGGVLVVSVPNGKLPPRQPALDELPLQAPRDEGRVVEAGFGAVVYVRPTALADFGDRVVQHTRRLGDLRAYRDLVANRDSRLLEEERGFLNEVAHPPAGGLLALLAVFSVLVGPVAWVFWVHRKARPFVYLGTTIGLAFVFGGALMGADLADKGMRPLVQSASITLRDERTGTQLEVGRAVTFAPIGLGTAVRVPSDAVLLVHAERGAVASSSQRLTLDPGTQRLDGAIPVRAPSSVQVRRLSRAQGRLVVGTDGNGIFVENQLPCALEALFVWHGGRRLAFGPIERGERAHGREEASAEAPDAAGGPELATATALLRSVTAGERGRERYVGRCRGADLRTALFPSGVREMTTLSGHLIAGTYR